MSYHMTAGEQNLVLAESLIPDNEKFFIWAYSIEKECIGTSCPEEERDMLDYMFRLFSGPEKAAEYAGSEGRTPPLIIGSAIGLQWAAIYDHGRNDKMIIVLGPVFYSTPVINTMHAAIHAADDTIKNGMYISQFIASCTQIPVLSYAIFSRYTIMLHNMLNGEQLGISDLHYPELHGRNIHADPAGVRNRAEVYHAEQALLKMVRNGDISYQDALGKSISVSPGVGIREKEPLRQAKTSIIVFTSLVCRAAMEGGLSPDIAYSLGDSYIQAAEDCNDSGELSSLAYAMYRDFIYRVHQVRANPNWSHAVQKCCDYIELNLNRKISASDLADLVGYTEYYLTQKFKKETGMSVSRYIRFARIEKAKVLLETTDLTIAEISEKLGFNTPNYFIQCFREITSQTPGEYRAEYDLEKTDVQQ